MHRLLRAATVFCCLLANLFLAFAPLMPVVAAQSVPPNFVRIVSTNLVNVASATACVQPNAGGVAISVNVNSAGTTTKRRVCTTVTDGSFTLLVPDGKTTHPANPCYALTVTDNVTGTVLLDNGYSCLQPSSDTTIAAVAAWCSTAGSTTTCSLDNYLPNTPAVPITQSGPVGPAGPSCSAVSGVCVMTVPVQLPADPVAPLQAASKQYVDNATLLVNPLANQFIKAPVGTSLHTTIAGNTLYSKPQINTFGDSITDYTGCTVQAKCYASKVLAAFGGGNNYAVSGTWAENQTAVMYAQLNPTHDDNSWASLMVGTNNASFCGGSAGCLANYYHSVLSGAAWTTIPLEYKMQAQTPACTTTGTWTNASFGNALGMQSTVPGSTMTCTSLTSGASGLYVAWEAFVSGNTSTASISVDGAAQPDALAGYGYSGVPVNANTSFATLYPVSGSGTHTFTVTVTSAGAGSPFVFLWGGSPSPTASTPMANITANPPRLALMGVLWQGGNAIADTTLAYYNADILISQQLSGDGAIIPFVPTRDYVNYTTDFLTSPVTLPNGQVCPASEQPGPPLVHPDNCGHQHLFDILMQTIGSPTGASTTLPYLFVNSLGGLGTDATELSYDSSSHAALLDAFGPDPATNASLSLTSYTSSGANPVTFQMDGSAIRLLFGTTTVFQQEATKATFATQLDITGSGSASPSTLSFSYNNGITQGAVQAVGPDTSTPGTLVMAASSTDGSVRQTFTLNNTTATSTVPIGAPSLAAENGFTGTKTAGSCTFTIVSGIITNVSGC